MKYLFTRGWISTLFIIFVFFCCVSIKAQQINAEHKGQQSAPPKTSADVVKNIQNEILSEISPKGFAQIPASPTNILDNYAYSHQLLENWNGTSWENAVQIDYTYNAQGWLTEAVTQQWSSGNWVNYSRYTYTYTGEGLVASQITYTWGSSDWINTDRYSYAYDVNGNQTLYIHENWNDSIWVKNYRYIYTYYSGTGNQYTKIYQTWAGSDWLNSSAHMYLYNTSNLMTQDLWLYWSGSNWVNQYKHSYTYLNNNVLNDTVFQWSASQWTNHYLYSYTYNSSSLETEELDQYWDTMNGWINSHMYSYTYDPSGNKTVEMRQDWSDSLWVNYYMYMYTYNASNQMVDQTYQKWNLGTGWENVDYYTYAYDSNGNQSVIVNQTWDGAQWVNNTRLTNTWINILNDVANEGTIKTYTLSQNYPNPFNPTTKIQFRIADFGFVSLKVYDVLGREVATLVDGFKHPGNYEVEFNGSKLPSGIYFYKLTAGKFSQVKKMILLK